MEILESQLSEAGYETWRLDKNFVAFKFLIPHGRFRGKTVDIALQAPNFPEIPPSGPHIKPHLLPITGGGGVRTFGGIKRWFSGGLARYTGIKKMPTQNVMEAICYIMFSRYVT